MYPHRIKNAVIYKNKKVNLEIMKKKGGQKVIKFFTLNYAILNIWRKWHAVS